MLTRADLALYRAKSEGSDGFCFFTEAMDFEVRTRVTLGSELREAIASSQLFLVYQPQVVVASGAIVGVEALVRCATRAVRSSVRRSSFRLPSGTD